MGYKNKEFIEKYGQEAFDRIFYTLYGDVPQGVVVFERVEELDAINREAEGYININGRQVNFHIEDGNWRGSVMWEFSEKPITVDYYRNIAVFVLDESRFNEDELPRARMWFKQAREMIQAKQSAYNYDKHVTGGSHQVNQHYRQWLHAHKLKVDYKTIKID